MEQWNEHWPSFLPYMYLPFELEAFFLRKRREKAIGKGGKRRRRQNQHAGELSGLHRGGGVVPLSIALVIQRSPSVHVLGFLPMLWGEHSRVAYLGRLVLIAGRDAMEK